MRHCNMSQKSFRNWIIHCSSWDAAIIHQQLVAKLRGHLRFVYIITHCPIEIESDAV